MNTDRETDRQTDKQRKKCQRDRDRGFLLGLDFQEKKNLKAIWPLRFSDLVASKSISVKSIKV